MTAPFPSATVAPLRERERLEVLLLRRHPDLAFHGGDWVFPGGRIEAHDADGDPLATARRAAVREAHEEATLRLDPSDLVPFGHWTTPRCRPRRYATWFFLAPADAPARADGQELVEARWWPIEDALAARASRTIRLPPPTFVTLCRLRGHTLEEAMALSHEERILPKIVPVPGGECALYPGDAGYASGDPKLAGPRHRGWYLRSGWRYERSDEREPDS